jgi:DNA-binding MarR family transcriptional regulator
MATTTRPRILQAIETLQQLSELFRLRRRQLAAEVGLTETQWQLFEEVAEEHFMPSLFARERDCAPAVVSRGLRSLVDAGLVESSIGEADARHRVYRLTATGRGLQRRLRKRRAEAIDAVWEPLSERELAAFIRTAGEIAERLSTHAKHEAERA